MQNQLNESPRFNFRQKNEEVEEVFCICRGANPSGFFVACEAGSDCPYNGWLHPECTEDLKNKTQDYIDNLGAWYCQACTKRMNGDDSLDRN